MSKTNRFCVLGLDFSIVLPTKHAETEKTQCSYWAGQHKERFLNLITRLVVITYKLLLECTLHLPQLTDILDKLLQDIEYWKLTFEK